MNKRSKVKSKAGPSAAGHKKTSPSGVVNVYIHPKARKAGKAMAETLTPSRIIESIQNGLPVRELDDLQASLDVEIGKLASMLGISKATLHRRKAQGRLEPAESDRVLRFARLMGKAVAVFGGIEAARQWLTSAQFGLGGAVPLDYAKTEPGAREVENLLGRIEYGVYS
jgi:putative toxin-antitoxin system antitoxin component (TIGR02293 family)